MVQNAVLPKITKGLLRRLDLAAIALIVCVVLVPSCAAKKHVKAISTPDGKAIRKVYIRTASPETANSVSADLTLDTCLTAVRNEDQADAVLDVGMALPGLLGAAPTPNVFVPSATAQTMGNSKNGHIHSASATCTDGKNGGCSNSYNVQGGDLGADLPPGFAKTGGQELDVSLISTGKASQELWQPRNRSKRPWLDQLRKAAGCPVCPGEHFNRRKDRTYRNWIQAKCPNVLASSRNSQ